MSKYVDGLQQIVPAANQLETICRHSSPGLTVPLESPNVALLPHQAHKKARICPESLFVALSYFCGSLTHALMISSSHQRSERQKHLQLSTRIARCSANAGRASYYARPTPWAAPSKLFLRRSTTHTEIYPTSVRRQVPFAHP